jgi:hypothetical protein
LITLKPGSKRSKVAVAVKRYPAFPADRFYPSEDLVISRGESGILRPMPTPEDQAREHIDQALKQAGWRVQGYKSANLQVGRGVVLRNFPLINGHGLADYLLYVDGKAAEVVEAKSHCPVFEICI